MSPLALDFDVAVMSIGVKRDVELAEEQAELAKAAQETGIHDVRTADSVGGVLRF